MDGIDPHRESYRIVMKHFEVAGTEDAVIQFMHDIDKLALAYELTGDWEWETQDN